MNEASHKHSQRAAQLRTQEFSSPFTALRWTAFALLCASCNVVFGYTHSNSVHLGCVRNGNPRSRGSRCVLSAAPKQRSTVAESLPTSLPSLTDQLTPTKKMKTTKSKKGMPRKPSGMEMETVDTDQTKATKRKKKSTDRTHWIVESDEVIFRHMEVSPHELDPPLVPVVTPLPSLASLDSIAAISESSHMNSLLRFTVRGNPLPLRRHRTNRGFVYNPSAVSQKNFREAVEQLVFARPHNSTNGTSTSTSTAVELDSNSRALPVPNQPLWGPEQVLAVTIIFRMKRPNNHFIGGKRGLNRLRLTAPSQTSGNLRTDVDNLAKFVLDSLNGVLYTDDRQIASLHVTKLFDNDVDELCLGSTCVSVRILQDKDVSRLLANSLDLY